MQWRCYEGHEWSASFGNVKHRNSWCPTCAGNQRKDVATLHALATAKNGRCLSTEYVNIDHHYLWECSKGHRWEASAQEIKRTWCPKCTRRVSAQEQEICAFLESNGVVVLANKKSLLANKRYELDIFVPSMKKAVEFDGDYWHDSHAAKVRDSYKNQMCKDAGISLKRVRWTEYKNDPERVKAEVLAFVQAADSTSNLSSAEEN